MKTFAICILSVGFFAFAGCGSVKPILEEHQDDIAKFEKCAVNCGVESAVDALACPISGGNWQDIINGQIASGLAKDAGACIVVCMTNSAVDLAREVCSKKASK